MRKLIVTSLATLSFAAAATPAGAQVEVSTAGPCMTTFTFMEENGIQLGMYHPLIALAIRTACGNTG